jgi:hypothetical protein
MPSGMPDLKNHIIFSGIILLLLLFLWGCTPDPVETNLLLPVEFSNVPDGMVVTQFHTDKIEIRIKADPGLIEKINEKHIQYQADLYTDLDIDPAGASDSIGPGYYLLPVDKRRIPVDPEITIMDITPSYLGVRLEKIITRTYKIDVPYSGDPPRGYIILEPAPEPGSVTLSGAASLIDKIQVLKTKPVDLTNARETFKKEVPLDLENPHLFTASAPIIVVTVKIREKQVEKTIETLPIQIRNCPFTAGIEPDAISIRIKGPYETIGSKEILDQIFAFIDLEGLSPGVYVRHVYINIPVGLTMTRSEPQAFTVKIE